MLDEEHILERLRLGEDSTTEFKSVAATDFLQDRRRSRELVDGIARSIGAFANSGGGLLLLGVEDDGTLTGVGAREQSDDLMRRVANICSTAIQPAITCGLHIVEVQGERLLVVDVPGFGPGRPYGIGGRYYVRDANQCRPANTGEIRRLLESADYHYDEARVPGATSSDLDEDAIAHVLQSVNAPVTGEAIAQFAAPTDAPSAEVRDAAAAVARLLTTLRCLDLTGAPTVAGILFLARDPGRWLSDARVSVVRIRGVTANSEFQARKELVGRLPQQIDGAMQFLTEYLRSPSHVEGWRRAEEGVPPDAMVPLKVLREAVLNAVMHRDYHMASQTRVFVFDDRFEILNPGTLLNRLTLDDIRLVGTSQRRNPAIAALLSRVLDREALGMGIPAMIELMRKHGLPEPQFDLPGGHFRVVLWARPSGAL